MKEVAPSHDDEIPKEHDMLEPQEPPHKRKPAWALEIIQEAERYGVPERKTRNQSHFLVIWL